MAYVNERVEFALPVEQPLAPMDFQIGTLMRRIDGEPGSDAIVSIMLIPPSSTPLKPSVLMHDWDELNGVLSALVECAVRAWGLPEDAIDVLPGAGMTEH